MSDKFSTFMERMTKFNWFRLTVCLLPGLFIAKLGSKMEGLPYLQLAGSICLIVGVGIYAFWGRIAEQYFGSEDEDEDEEDDATEEKPSTTSPARSMSDLVTLCDGNYEEATNLVSIENQMNADISFSAAVTAAYQRKYLSLKSH